MRIASVLIAMAAVALPHAFAQQSLFQSSNGQTSLYIQQPTATLNFGDSKASLGFTRHDNLHVIWGYELYAKANSGVASLFSSDKPKAPEGGGDVTIGRHFWLVANPEDHKSSSPSPEPQPGQIVEVKHPLPAREDWWLIDVGYGRSSFYVSDKPVAASTANRSFDRFRATAAYNYFADGTWIVGLAGGAERRNNLDDLKTAVFQTVVAPAPTGTQNSIVSQKTGYYGKYQEYVAVPIYGDILHYLPGKVPGFGNRYALDGFIRSNVAGSHRQVNGGLGLFFFKSKQALTPIGGANVSFDGSKVTAGLTVGITI